MWTAVVRSLGMLALVAGLAACPQGASDSPLAVGDDEANPPEPGARGCSVDEDCALAAAACCECPTIAVAAGDPKLDACSDVDCMDPAPTCSRVRAVCEENLCEVKCEPQAVAMSCANGYATDAAGCLIDACAEPQSECTFDDECVQTRADCCGCARGGSDTAVPTDERSGFDAALGCTGNEACPEVSTCVAAELPRCAQGSCKLIAGELPADACGRPDLPACELGKTCTVNANNTADLYGVGVCL